MYSVGIDIGGTFTDMVFWDDETKGFITQKVLTTAREPQVGVLDGFVSGLAKGSVSARYVKNIVHATTLASNAIIHRRGATTAFVTTEGFRDVLEMGRGKKPVLYDLFYERAEPLVPRRLCYEIKERVAADGRILAPLAEDEVRQVANELRQHGLEAVAICFLHSFRNTDHERRVGMILRKEAPHLFVSLSSEVAPEIREYERASTTVANAYLQPVMSRYLSQLTEELEGKGFRGRVFVMLSSGGTATVETAVRFPVRVVESGPAAGAMAAGFLGSLIGEEHLLCLDMGGTTAKICVITRAKPMVAAELEVARVYRFKKGSGIPLKVPSVELVEIGAGGGSIAYVDKYGLLRVGPQSAESNPGPACYDLGGEEPTVTDADLFLGYLDPAYFLGGKMRLNEERARRAISDKLARPLGIDERSAAWGIFQVVNSNMVSATQVYGAEKGLDLRCYPLLAFGGAGPMHACAVAEQLGIGKVVIPLRAGLISAFGLLVTPPAFDFARSYMGRLTELDWSVVEANYETMEGEGRALLRSMGLQEGEIEVIKTADMRYAGQSYEITVALPPGSSRGAGYLDRVEEAFTREYERLYQRANRDFPIEALMWRALVRGPQPQIRLAALRGRDAPSTIDPLKGTRHAYFADFGGFMDCRVFDRYSLNAGFSFLGPAIVEEVECTTLVRPRWEAKVDQFLNLILTRT